MTLNDLRLGADQRGAIIGQSGTGKSFLARRLLPASGQLAIIDPKRMFDYGTDVQVFDSASRILKVKPKRFIYRPIPSELANLAEHDRVYRYAYERGNFTIYTDDVVGIMTRSRFPDFLRICYMMGRQKNVSMLSAFQRPAWLPMFLCSESVKFYCFYLGMKQDQDKVSEWCNGYDPRALLAEPHAFFFQSYAKPHMMTAVKTKLKVK